MNSFSSGTKTCNQAFVFFREFVVGNNQTGLVVSDKDGNVTVIGGEDQDLLSSDILPGRDGILYGSGKAITTYVFPEATRSAWKEFVTAETKVFTPTNNGAASGFDSWFTWTVLTLITVSSVYVL